MTNWSIFFNLDFLYYLIYVFFRSIFGWFTLGGSGNLPSANEKIGILTLLKFMSGGSTNISDQAYHAFGQGIGALYDGYSLFTPPHGLSEFGSFSAWWQNFTTNPYCASCPSFADLFFGGLNGFLWIIVIFLVIGLFYIKIKLREVEEMEEIKYDTIYKDDTDAEQSEQNLKTQQWLEILKLSNSQNVNDKKTAIINADNLLETILKEHGYEGKTLGEILKNSDFETVQNAWSAHNVRNKIAHDPTFILTDRETKRVIQNYSKVFGEFYYL